MKIMRVKQQDGTLVDIPIGVDTASSAVSAHNTNTSAHADIREQISQLSSEKVDKTSITLGVHTDGLLYVFVDGKPVGNGIALPSGGASGDVVGNIDSGNNIILTGNNIPVGTHKMKFKYEDGTYSDEITITIGAMPEPEPDTPEPKNFANPQSADFKTEFRLTTDINQTKTLTGGVATNYIDVQTGDVVEVKGINFVDTNNRQAANGSFGGIATASALKDQYGEYFGYVSYDENSLTLTVLCDATQMRFSGIATGTPQDVIVNIKRNGSYLYEES